MAYNPGDPSSTPSASDIPSIIGSMLGGAVTSNPDGSYTVTSGTHQGYTVNADRAAQILKSYTPAAPAGDTGWGGILKYVGIPLAAAFGGEALAGAFGGGAGAAGSATAASTGAGTGIGGGLGGGVVGGSLVPGAGTAAAAGTTAAGVGAGTAATAAAAANPFAKLIIPGLISGGANLASSLIQRSSALTASQQEIAAGQQALSLESSLYDKGSAGLAPFVSGGQQSYANLQQFMAGGKR